MHPATVMSSVKQLVQPAGTGASRLLLLAVFAALTLAISGPAAADKHGHQDHKRHPQAQHQQHKHHQYLSKSKHPHQVRHSHQPRHVHKTQHIYHHHPAPPRHAPVQGFSVNIWGIAPLLSGHNHHLSTSFHYHGQERCYHRH